MPRIAAQLLAQRAVVYPDAVPVASIATESTSAPQTAALADTETVLVDPLELVRPRSIGVEHVACWAMQQVGFHELLIECGLSGPLWAAILGVIIGRMAAPDSEAATHRWLGQHSGLGELLDVDFERLPAMTLYRASDALMKHRALIERTLFDLTNTYFEGQAETHPKAKHGRSKEKRSDCPLVTLGLVLDGSGFVRRSEVFEGNVAEVKTLDQMLNALETLPGTLIVMDACIANEGNLIWLREHGYRYLVVSRERARPFEAKTAIPIETAAGHSVQIQRVDDPERQEVRLYCHSEQREHKEQAIDQRFCERFEAGLQKIADGLLKPRGEKRLAKLQERLGRLKEKSHGVGQHYMIELIPDPAGENSIELRWSQQIKSGTRLSHPGVYCLRSNQTDWDSERLWRTYIMLTDLEAVFRSLKSELGLRPVYHRKEEPVDGHLFITVLAYL